MTYKNEYNRADIYEIRSTAPDVPDDEICCIAGCGKPASDYWLPAVCALSEAGIEPDWVGLCPEHDVMLNETYLRLLTGSKYDEQLVAYRQRKLGGVPLDTLNEGKKELHQAQVGDLSRMKPTGYTIGIWGDPVADFTPSPKEPKP